MSRKTDRDQLVAELARALPQCSTYQVVELARKLRRAGATLQRLAEAQCNGDWPADNGERQVVTCVRCEQSWVPSVLKRTAYMSEGKGGRTYYRPECPDCRTQARVSKLLAEYGLVPYFQGDPRGAVLKVFRAGVSEGDKQSGRERGIYVA